jgi:hypothetical protein
MMHSNMWTQAAANTMQEAVQLSSNTCSKHRVHTADICSSRHCLRPMLHHPGSQQCPYQATLQQQKQQRHHLQMQQRQWQQPWNLLVPLVPTQTLQALAGPAH